MLISNLNRLIDQPGMGGEISVGRVRIWTRRDYCQELASNTIGCCSVPRGTE